MLSSHYIEYPLALNILCKILKSLTEQKYKVTHYKDDF